MGAEAVFFPLFILLIVGAIVWALLAQRRREKRMQAAATARGWSYERLDKRLWREYKGFEPFSTGSGRHARHIVEGHAGAPFRAFQYQYTVSTGKSSQTYYFHVLDVAAPLHAGVTAARLGAATRS